MKRRFRRKPGARVLIPPCYFFTLARNPVGVDGVDASRIKRATGIGKLVQMVKLASYVSCVLCKLPQILSLINDPDVDNLFIRKIISIVCLVLLAVSIN